MKICKKCVLPEGFPHVTFDKEGVCGLCRERMPQSERRRVERDCLKKFKALLKAVKGKGVYDILMCYSGGKDSTYALYILKAVYRLKVLAFTLDNGFIPEGTYENIRNVVERLDVDHIFFKPRFGVLKKIFRAAMTRDLYSAKATERANAVCVSCIGLVKYSALKTAVEKGIPMVGFGWSPGQAPLDTSVFRVSPKMMRSMEKTIKGPLSSVAGRRAVEPYFLSTSDYKKRRDLPYYIHPLLFLGYDEKKISEKNKKLGWKAPPGLDNSTNCLLNSLAIACHEARYHFNPYAFMTAKMVRDGYITRKEGLKRIRGPLNKKTIAYIKNRLGA